MQKITSTLLLRVAATLMLLHTIAHFFAILNWQQPGSDVPTDLVQKMQDTHFLVKGEETTMAESFTGSGYSVSIFLLFISIILWVFSNRIEKDTEKILLLTGLVMSLLVIDEFSFFFPMAAILTSIATILVFISIYKRRRQDRLSMG